MKQTKDTTGKTKILDPEHTRTEEVQDIIERMPTYWTKWIALVVTILIGTTIGLGFIIKYPDSVGGKISVTAQVAPVRLISNANGKIYLLRKNKSELKKGDVISHIENEANYGDILKLDSLVKLISINKLEKTSLPITLMLGNVSSSFNSFAIIFNQYKRMLISNLYSTMRKKLTAKIDSEDKVILNIKKELKLKNRIFQIAKKHLSKDSILLCLNGITEQEYHSQNSKCLSIEESLLSLKSRKLSKQSQIDNYKIEIQKITIQEYENKDKLISEFFIRKNELTNAINIWKKHYLQFSPINGKLEYLGFWRNNIYIKSGEELFSIIPPRSTILGEVTVPSFGAGKIKVGQLANVRINNYPSDEYGLLKGIVKSVSNITHKIKTAKGVLDGYLILISFPDGNKSNFGINLPLDCETKGRVDIITKPKRLIQRLFDNLKSKTEK